MSRIVLLLTVALITGVQASRSFAQAPATPQAHSPSFASGGIKLTIASVAANPNRDTVTVSVIVSNDAQSDILLSILGPIEAIDDAGMSYRARKVNSFSHCGGDVGENKTADQLQKDCVNSQRENSFQNYTEIDKGNSTVVPMTFIPTSFGPNTRGKQFSFSMRLAVVQDTAQADGSSLSSKGSNTNRVKFITVGIPLVPLSSPE